MFGLLVAAYLAWWNMEVVRSAEGAFDFDVGDPRRLVGFSDAVFVGRVVDQVGSSAPADDPFPRTQFRVQVLRGIKSVRRSEGQVNSLPSEPTVLPDSVVVDQYGGYERDSTGKQVLWLMNGVPLLEPGKTYLLATRYNRENDWYHLSEGEEGVIPLSDAQDLSSVVEKFERARSEQIPYDIHEINEINERHDGSDSVRRPGEADPSPFPGP